MKRRRSKFGNVPTTVDGIRFASRAEARYYGRLKLLHCAEQIFALQFQPRYNLVVSGVKVCTYVADFCFIENRKSVAIDVKGVETAVFKIKAKLFRALYPHVELRVVKA